MSAHKAGTSGASESESPVVAQERSSSLHAPRRSKLRPTTVFVRVRPMATEGGHAAGEEAQHRLEGWTDDSVIMWDSARNRKVFDFPTRVVLPEATQQEAYDTMLPPLVDGWLNKGHNLMVLAYGQTGTGKTHTMFGPESSLQTNTADPDWGVLPRVVDACFQLVEANRGRVSYVVAASALEFYLGLCFDLLNDHIPVQVDAGGVCMGQQLRVIESMDGFYNFLADVKANRTTRATKMNSESSRSHCALLISLFQVDHASGMFTMTKFNLFDLAGSERPGKAGGERTSALDVGKVLYDVYMGRQDMSKVPTGVQMQCINMELTTLRSEIASATDLYKRGVKYNPPRTLSTDFQRYTGEIMTGRTLLTTIICISPAPQNGSENLFSLKWGEGMAQLRAPNVTEQAVEIQHAHAAAATLAERAAKELEAREPSNKFWVAYKSRADSAAQRRDILASLMHLVA